MPEEHGHESGSNETQGDTFTVRDSVFALLADQTIPASGFIHLYDTSPYSIRNGHVVPKDSMRRGLNSFAEYTNWSRLRI